MPPPPIARRSTPRVARISDRSASAPGRFGSWITNWLAMVVSPPDHAAWWRQVYDLRRRPGARPPTGRARGRQRVVALGTPRLPTRNGRRLRGRGPVRSRPLRAEQNEARRDGWGRRGTRTAGRRRSSSSPRVPTACLLYTSDAADEEDSVD